MGLYRAVPLLLKIERGMGRGMEREGEREEGGGLKEILTLTFKAREREGEREEVGGAEGSPNPNSWSARKREGAKGK